MIPSWFRRVHCQCGPPLGDDFWVPQGTPESTKRSIFGKNGDHRAVNFSIFARKGAAELARLGAGSNPTIPRQMEERQSALCATISKRRRPYRRTGGSCQGINSLLGPHFRSRFEEERRAFARDRSKIAQGFLGAVTYK